VKISAIYWAELHFSCKFQGLVVCSFVPKKNIKRVTVLYRKCWCRGLMLLISLLSHLYDGMDPDQCWVAMHSSPGQCFWGFFVAKSRDSLDNVRTLQVRRNNSNICHEVEERWLRKKRCFHNCIHYTLLAWLLSSSSYCKPTWRIDVKEYLISEPIFTD
jgi:hypothetical protein